MRERFSFDDPLIPLPPAAVDAEPSATLRELFYRLGRLERSLDEERAEAQSELAEALLEIVSIHDDVTAIIERWGVSTRATEAAIAASVLALGKKLIAILGHHRVRAINVLGAPLDPANSDVAGSEVNEDLPPNTVLREAQVGYLWEHGTLRRARVVVSARPPEPGPHATATPQPDASSEPRPDA